MLDVEAVEFDTCLVHKSVGLAVVVVAEVDRTPVVVVAAVDTVVDKVVGVDHMVDTEAAEAGHHKLVAVVAVDSWVVHHRALVVAAVGKAVEHHTAADQDTKHTVAVVDHSYMSVVDTDTRSVQTLATEEHQAMVDPFDSGAMAVESAAFDIAEKHQWSLVLAVSHTLHHIVRATLGIAVDIPAIVSKLLAVVRV